MFSYIRVLAFNCVVINKLDLSMPILIDMGKRLSHNPTYEYMRICRLPNTKSLEIILGDLLGNTIVIS